MTTTATSPAPRPRAGTVARTAMALLLLITLHLNQRLLLAPAAPDAAATTLDHGSLPPTLALVTIALGPVRGLVADLLWWRAVQFQDNGDYFEIIQLADWITAMQPRQTHVWAFQAWNMCYNIAYEFPDDDDRWPWIERALNLLRIDALRANPDNPHLHAEITRIFQDRISKSINSDHDAFVRKWAVLIMEALPRGDRAELADLAAAPRSPDAIRADPAVAALLAAAAPHGVILLQLASWRKPATWPDALSRLRTDPAHAQAWRELDRWHRATLLRTHHRIDPQHALDIEARFGPLDWRLPQAQTLYWGHRDNPDEQVILGLDYGQLVRQAMENAMLHGRLLADPEAGILVTIPNLDMIGRINDFYLDTIPASRQAERDRILHREFLERAAVLLYSCDRADDARRLHAWMGSLYGIPLPEFEAFVADRLFVLLLGHVPANRVDAVRDALNQAYSWLASGDPHRATGFAKFATLLWQQAVEAGDAPPALDQLRQEAIGQLLMGGMAESYKRRLVQRATNPDLAAAPIRPAYLGRDLTPPEVPR